MPAAPEILRLVRLFPDFDDLRKIGHAADEFMNVEVAKAAAKGEMLLRRQMLVMEKDNLMIEQGLAYVGDYFVVVDRLRQIDPDDVSAERPRGAAQVE